MSPAVVSLFLVVVCLVVLFFGFYNGYIPWAKVPPGMRAYWYSNVFDTPPDPCPYCRKGTVMLLRSVPVKAPDGKVFGHNVRAGFACLRCRVASMDRMAPAKSWASLDYWNGLPPIGEQPEPDPFQAWSGDHI